MAAVSIAPKGLLFGKYAKALLVADGDVVGAHAFAQGQGPLWHDVALALKASVSAMATGDDGALTTPIAFDFAEALRPATLLGRIAGLRRVPFNIKMIGTATGAAAHWVGEADPGPVGALDFDSAPTLPPTKLQSMSVHTRELARSSAPGVEAVLAADAIAAAAQAADLALVDSDNAGSASKPGAITAGAQAVPSTGSSIAQIDADLRGVIAVLNDANIDLSAAVWLLSPNTATYMATLRGSGGAAAYPGLGPRGGKLLEMPALCSNALTTAESPSESSIVLLAASELLLADDGEARVELAQHASVQMADNPSSGEQSAVSLWQANLVGLRATRTVHWKLRRSAACAYVSQVQF